MIKDSFFIAKAYKEQYCMSMKYWSQKKCGVDVCHRAQIVFIVNWSHAFLSVDTICVLQGRNLHIRIFNHGYEPQSKLWKQFRSKLRDIVTPLCGIFPISLLLLDNSAKKLQCAMLLKFKPYYDLQISMHFVFEIWVSQ